MYDLIKLCDCSLKKNNYTNSFEIIKPILIHLNNNLLDINLVKNFFLNVSRIN